MEENQTFEVTYEVTVTLGENSPLPTEKDIVHAVQGISGLEIASVQAQRL